MRDMQSNMAERLLVVGSGSSRYQFHRHIAVTVIHQVLTIDSLMASFRRQLSEQPDLQ